MVEAGFVGGVSNWSKLAWSKSLNHHGNTCLMQGAENFSQSD